MYLKLNNKEQAEYLYFMAVAAGKSSVCVYKFCLILLDLLCDSKVEMKVLLQSIQAGITHQPRAAQMWEGGHSLETKIAALFSFLLPQRLGKIFLNVAWLFMQPSLSGLFSLSFPSTNNLLKESVAGEDVF